MDLLRLQQQAQPQRLAHVGRVAEAFARKLQNEAVVERVLHPALPSCPGHAIWKRDFKGSTGLFSFVLKGGDSTARDRLIDSLELFGIGYSWGGANSLVMTYGNLKRPTPQTGPLLVRLNVGLEDPLDLIEDLEQALAAANNHSSR